MSKNVAMFVDVANMYYAARGQDVDVDYVALLKHATKGRDLIRAYAYTGLDPENENQRKFIDFLAKNGYKPVVKDIRKFGDGRMKANLDIELVVDLFRLADRMDIAVIVSGDGDFAPAIRALQDKGVRAEVISFKPNTSSDLIAVADEFQDIMKVASISRKKAAEAVRESAASMSMPEMPAKEVTPEFGFREASPSVAAAALAALKGGGATNGRRTRAGTGRRTPAAAAAQPLAPAEQPPGEQVVATADAVVESEEQARRRRRRRGGRGRGRGRREEGAATVAGDASPEPSEGGAEWEEFDDLSQLDLGAGGEITFAEADEATLAELGLTPEDVVGTPTPDGAEAEAETDATPKPRARQTRARKTGVEAPPTADGEAAPKPRRRSPRAKPADATDGDAPPARRRSPRATKSGDDSADPKSEATASGGTEGEPQGIWGRFRSARKPRTAG